MDYGRDRNTISDLDHYLYGGSLVRTDRSYHGRDTSRGMYVRAQHIASARTVQHPVAILFLIRSLGPYMVLHTFILNI
jgi:hypothetical protein